MKERGVLLPIFSLPSKYGIGDFGKEAYEFVDILSENSIKYWEILPINACGRYPYSPVSYYALEESYISLDSLVKDGLLEFEVKTRKVSNRATSDSYKHQYFKLAYYNFKPDAEYFDFIRNIEILHYAQYRCEKSGESTGYYLFLQYIAYKQWMRLKAYANKKNVEIIGDMPAYPVFDSAETMYHPECFEMKDGKFTFEAGTPPDYYNDDGQKWNCPVYNVESIKNNNYEYLVKRYKYYLTLFDKVRIDYFRGYDSFYRIPIGESGKNGEYVDGFSYGFFDELFKDESVNKDSLIIEDLGDIREETVALREHYGFARQKILEFAINLYNQIDLDNEQENVLMFPANHDCATIKGWYNELSDENKENLKSFLRKNECNDIDINVGIMEYSMKCKARIVVITVQDILGLGNEARINLPGVDTKENWSWKLIDFKELKEKIKLFK